MAVSKTKPVSELMQAYDAGQRIFGENKVQEMTIKQLQMPKDVKWHMIGHLQRNKVKQIISFIHLIHSVDSIRVLNKINDEAKKINRTNIKFKVGSALNQKVYKKSSKDIVISAGVMPIFSNYKDHLDNLIYWAKPGSVIIIMSIFNENNYDPNISYSDCLLYTSPSPRDH